MNDAQKTVIIAVVLAALVLVATPPLAWLYGHWWGYWSQ